MARCSPLILSLSLGSLHRLPGILIALIQVQIPLEFTRDPILDLAPSLLYSVEFGRVAPFRLRLSPQVLLCCGGRPAPSALRGQVWFSNLKPGGLGLLDWSLQATNTAGLLT